LLQYRYSVDSSNNVEIEESYFDLQQQPVLTRQGYAILRQTEDASGQLKRIRLYDTAGNPASANWLGTANVAEAEYVEMQAVTPVTFAILRDAAGKIIDRKQVSGLTSAT